MMKMLFVIELSKGIVMKIKNRHYNNPILTRSVLEEMIDGHIIEKVHTNQEQDLK